MPNKIKLDDLDNLNKGFKLCLERNYGKAYFEPVIKTQATVEEGIDNYLSSFEIDNKNIYVCNSITSSEKLNEIKYEIVNSYDQFSLDVIDYYERISGELDTQTGKSVSIIAKFFKSRKKKLESMLKRFNIQDSWNVDQIAKEFEFVLVKFLKDLIENTIRPISIGLKEHNVYQRLLGMFNTYLMKLGVYTRTYSVNKKLSEEDWNYLNPVDSDDCETPNLALKDVIKNIHSYPYFMGDNTLILEGEVILWRITK